MASEELIRAVKSYDGYAELHGITEELIKNYYIPAIKTAILSEKDIEYGLALAKRAKDMLEGICKEQTGGDMMALDSYCNHHGVSAGILDSYYTILDMEGPHLFDSYMLALERNRKEEDRFYSPKRNVLRGHGLIQAMQDLEDDLLDILTISMCPGSGKCQNLSSKVLTPDGFVEMRDIKVGSKVISGTGNVCEVLGVYPQGRKDVWRITLENGRSCECSEEHLWTVMESRNVFDNELKTITLREIMDNGKEIYKIPYCDKLGNTVTAMKFACISEIKYKGVEECQCIYISDSSHLYVTDDYIITHNTTLEKFFASWIIGRHPSDYSLFYSHSDDITRMFYDGVLDITTNADEYRWGEIFPDVKFKKADAKRQQINFDKAKPFANLQCTSTGASNAGKVRCNRYLYCDDLISKQEEALNKKFLDKLWNNNYSVDAKQRKEDGCKEIHIATRWSIHDVIGRLQRLYPGDKRMKSITVRATDEVTGESNFNYKYKGMSKEFFRDQQLAMDEVSYNALYNGVTVERDGLLYSDDELRRYSELPEREPDAILGICDVKNKGTDYMFLPAMYQYGEDYYCADCVCDNTSNYEIQYAKLTNVILENNMQKCEFESNNGGDRVSHEVRKRVENADGRCHITEKATETNKETRIEVNSYWVKKHVLFKDKNLYTKKSDYGIMMDWLMMYSVGGKNEHDDVPDGFANFALFATKKTASKKVRIYRGIL